MGTSAIAIVFFQNYSPSQGCDIRDERLDHRGAVCRVDLEWIQDGRGSLREIIAFRLLGNRKFNNRHQFIRNDYTDSSTRISIANSNPYCRNRAHGFKEI